MQNLTDEQAQFADRALKFMAQMDTLFFDRVGKLNDGIEIETKSFNYDVADNEVKVARGSVIEKAGRLTIITKKVASELQQETVWSRFFALDAHPKTPLCGMLHAAFLMQFRADGTSSLGGWLDVMPATRIEEDLAHLKQTMDDVYAKYGIDDTPRRRLSPDSHSDDDPGARWRRRSAGVGGSFYGYPMLSVTEENYSFMTEAYEGFVDAYLTQVEMRKDDAYGAEDLAAQDAMRRNWLEDQLFADPYSKSIVPYEVWSLANVPPTVKF